MLSVFTPYSTAKPYFGPAPSWIPSAADQERINAYSLYEQIYWSVPESFKLQQRGADSQPIYLPNARTIVETTHRFLAVGLDYTVDAAVGTPADQGMVTAALKQLWAREKLRAKLTTQKRFCLIRGDAVWHVVADPAKPPGSRISIYDIDPSTYFPIEDPELPGRIIGCHLVTQWVDEVQKKTFIRRRTYRKDETTNPTTITSELILFELTGWDDRYYGAVLKQVQVLEPLFTLPAGIDALPVYLVKNFSTSEDIFGSSILRGFERVMGGVDQSISDEELTLAMQGLGVYATNSGPPVDANNKETLWKIGPGEVLELDAGGVGDAAVFFNRVEGVSTVAPMLDHIKFLQDQMYEASASPAIARGRVDVSLAESGISLRLQLAPLLSSNGERQEEMLPVLNSMVFDLVQKWFPAFEGAWSRGINVDVEMTVKDALPQNTEAKVKEIIALATTVPPIISTAHARLELGKLGYEFPAEMGADIVQEQSALAEAQQSDPFQDRVNEELARELATGGNA
jgi:hypothetical protein